MQDDLCVKIHGNPHTGHGFRRLQSMNEKNISAAGIDLDRYLERIGYAEDHAPATLDTLTQLHTLHAGAIAFENLSPLLGEAVHLDAVSLQDKLIRRGRGGWCFEQNLLFRHVLDALGFTVQGLAARVRWNIPQHVLTPRSHMLLLVELEGRRYIADVGFGGITLTVPLRIEPGTEQATTHEPFRLLQQNEVYTMEAKIRGAWTPLYFFDLQQHHLPDYQVSNWYLSNHPDSQFVSGLMAARPVAGGRHAMRNNRYSFHPLHGETETRVLTRFDDFFETLETAFGLRSLDVPSLETRFARLAETDR